VDSHSPAATQLFTVMTMAFPLFIGSGLSFGCALAALMTAGVISLLQGKSGDTQPQEIVDDTTECPDSIE
jgi:hypothetical protein